MHFPNSHTLNFLRESNTFDSKYLNFTTVSQDMSIICGLQFCPKFWRQDINTHVDFSVFASRATSLLASIIVSVFFFMVPILSPSTFTPST
jgi:hypothetical protein